MGFKVTAPANTSQLWSMLTTVNVYRDTSLLGYTDGRWRGQLQNNYQVHIPVPDLSNAAAKTRSRGDAYDTATDFSSNLIAHQIDKHAEQGNKIHYLDMVEVPWDIPGQAQSARENYMAIHVEDSLVDYIRSASTAAMTIGKPLTGSSNSPKADGSGSNGNAGKIGLVTVGSSTNKIPMNGVPANGTAKKAIYDSITMSAMHIRLANLASSRTVGGAVGNVGCWMRPELFDILADYLLDKDYHFDELTSGALKGPMVFGSQQWAGSLRGINIYVTNAIPAPTSNGANVFWDWFFMAPSAIAYSDRPAFVANWSEREYPTSPDRVDRVIQSFGHQLINKDHIWRFRIATG